MTNKQFQEALKKYADNYEISISNAIGWDYFPSLTDPMLFVNSDTGDIEISPEVIQNPWRPTTVVPKNGQYIVGHVNTDNFIVGCYKDNTISDFNKRTFSFGIFDYWMPFPYNELKEQY